MAVEVQGTPSTSDSESKNKTLKQKTPTSASTPSNTPTVTPIKRPATKTASENGESNEITEPASDQKSSKKRKLAKSEKISYGNSFSVIVPADSMLHFMFSYSQFLPLDMRRWEAFSEF